MDHVVALSGGKDSTALAIRMKEVWPQLQCHYVITPTGDELPEMISHWCRLEELLGTPLTRITTVSLAEMIRKYKMLPNWRARFCTRTLKIVPYLHWMADHLPATSYVGLRADEEERTGMETDLFETRYPLREWGWGIGQVQQYLVSRGVEVPRRTDCARCYAQTLHEWWTLWKEYPEIWESACDDERLLGHTFRSAQRDTWPAGLRDLAVAFRERGEPSQRVRNGGCKVCRM